MRFTKIFCIILALTTFITAAFFFQKHATEIIYWVEQLGWLAPVFFLILYCLGTIMFLPTMIITLAGGALFGPILGTLLNLCGAILGAASSFLITRYLIADWFSKTQGPILRKLINDVEQKGWVLIAILRLFPIIPFNLVNYGLGITQIKFRTYLITTLIFLTPPEIIYTYFGYAGMVALLQENSFYHNSGIIIAGITILLLCLCKFGLIKINRYYSQKTIRSLNNQLLDVPMQNQPDQKNESLGYPAKNS